MAKAKSILLDAAVDPEAPEPLQLTLKATARIRDLIIRRELLPGEKIRQVELAQQVGVSRSPLREALRTLESEGFVSYEANRGYVVSRLDANELAQIYRMRDLIESELLLTIKQPTTMQVQQLEHYNQEMQGHVAKNQLSEVLSTNRAFHFAIFDLSDKALYRREITRLWHLSEGYRATYLGMPETGARVVDEHEQIIGAVRDHDVARLVELCALHRHASERFVVGILASR